MGKQGYKIIIVVVFAILMLIALACWIMSDESSKKLNTLKSREKDILHAASLNHSSDGFYSYDIGDYNPPEKDVNAINLRLEEIALEIKNTEFCIKVLYSAWITCLVLAGLFVLAVCCSIPILDRLVRHYPHLKHRVPSCTFLRVFWGRSQQDTEPTDGEIARVIRVGYGPGPEPESVVYRRAHDKDDDDDETSAIHIISADLPGVPSTSSNLEG